MNRVIYFFALTILTLNVSLSSAQFEEKEITSFSNDIKEPFFQALFTDGSGNAVYSGKWIKPVSNTAHPVANRFGVANSAFHFNGFDPITYNVPNSMFYGVYPLMITCWIKPEDADINQKIIAKAEKINGQYPGVIIGIEYNKLYAEVRFSDGQSVVNRGEQYIPNNKWTQISIVYSYIEGLTGYINGKKDVLASFTKSSYIEDNDAYLFIGGWNWTKGQIFGNFGFHGIIDDVAMYALKSNYTRYPSRGDFIYELYNNEYYSTQKAVLSTATNDYDPFASVIGEKTPNCNSYTKKTVDEFRKEYKTRVGKISVGNKCSDKIVVSLYHSDNQMLYNSWEIDKDNGGTLMNGTKDIYIGNDWGIKATLPNGKSTCINLIEDVHYKSDEEILYGEPGKDFLVVFNDNDFKLSNVKTVSKSYEVEPVKMEDINKYSTIEKTGISSLPLKTSSPSSSISTTLPPKVYSFHKGNLVNINENFNSPSSINNFYKAQFKYDMYVDNGNLVLDIPDRTMGFAYVKDKEFYLKGKNFRTSVWVNGYGGFYLAKFVVTFNSKTGDFRISEWVTETNSWNNIKNGNLKNYTTLNEDDEVVPAYPYDYNSGFYLMEFFKNDDDGLSEVYINDACVYNGDLPYLEQPYVFGLCANPGITRFDNYEFVDGYSIYDDGIVKCPNEKFAIVNTKDEFLTECKFDELSEFRLFNGKYTLGKIDDKYILLDKSGNYVTADFSFTVTDPDFNSNESETFNCIARFKNGKLNGKYTINYSNGKLYCETNFINGEFERNTIRVNNKNGSLLYSDANENYNNYSSWDNMLLKQLTSEYYLLVVAGFFKENENKADMIFKPKK